MPIKQNAELAITYDPGRPPFHLFLRAYGSPFNVRILCKMALHGQRRQIMLDPEDFVVNLISKASRKVQLNITRRDAAYAFTYHINLIPEIPTVEVISHNQHTRETFNLFSFVGRDYRPVNITRPQGKPGKDHTILHNRRGRPSLISKMKEPLPERFK